jgi:hypothetical protein
MVKKIEPLRWSIVALITLLSLPSFLFAGSMDAIRSVDWPTTKFKTMDCIITIDAKRDWFGQIAMITGFHLDKIHGFAYRVLISENINQQSRWYRYEELEKIAVKVENCDLLE